MWKIWNKSGNSFLSGPYLSSYFRIGFYNNKKKTKNSNQKTKRIYFLVILDKICVFCFYPIPDSQQCVKRGNCRRPILSGLLFHFNFCWTLGLFMSRFEFGPRTYFVMWFIYFYRVFESFHIRWCFVLIFISWSNC